MAANTVSGVRGSGLIYLDLGAVVMGVVVEVGQVAGGAGAAVAAVDRGIAMAVDPDDSSTVFRGMTEGAIAGGAVAMYRSDAVA